MEPFATQRKAAQRQRSREKRQGTCARQRVPRIPGDQATQNLGQQRAHAASTVCRQSAYPLKEIGIDRQCNPVLRYHDLRFLEWIEHF